MDLMTNALTTISQALDQFIGNATPNTGPFVILGGPNNPDGGANESAQDKVVMALYGVVKETAVCKYAAAYEMRA